MWKTLLNCLIITSFLISCSKKEKSPVNGNGDPIIDEQYTDENMKFPKGIPLFIALIKLNNPALLSSAVKSETGEYSLDPNLKNSILEEQAEVIGKLKAISSKIKILQRYKMVLNGLAIEAPQSVAREINELKLGFIESNEPFMNDSSSSQNQDISLSTNNINSLTGADKVHKHFKEIQATSTENTFSIKGRGVTVGVIDSGIDFTTHRVFGGPGDPAVHKSIDPSKDTAFFPNNKIKGGRDFVGESFSISSNIYTDQIPRPDNNPMDGDKKDGHGTVVASIIAGKGDGIHTQDGIAPEAELYALKVSNGLGTSTMNILSALEYSADPNGDTSPEDRLDIVNISMEIPFGRPQGLYNEAITNLTKGGVLVIAAAGNQGPEPNIVGMPGTADDAISVASSLSFPKREDNDEPAIKFQIPNQPPILSKFKEGDMTTPISKIHSLKGKLFYIGLAREDLNQEQKNQLKGQVALIDRGEISFSEKIQRAYEAGATGVVIINNVEGEYDGPITGENKYPIPGAFITMDMGQIIKSELDQGEEILIDFKPTETIEKSQVIDTIAEFSSQGPRNLDSLIKPEITAPGVDIFSAKPGTGVEGIPVEGTSVSSPIVSGIAALQLQYRKNLSPNQVKSTIVNTGALINDLEKGLYPISRQGAGRVNAYRALKTEVVFSKPTISLGHISVTDQMNVTRSFYVENIVNHHVTYHLSSLDSETMKISFSKTQIDLAPGEKTEVDVYIQLKPGESITGESNGFIKISKGSQFIGFIPILAIISKTTKIQVDQMLIDSHGLSDSTGKNVEVTLSNESSNEGSAFPL